MTAYVVQLCLSRDESLAILSERGNIAADITHMIPWPAYSAADHADTWLRSRAFTRTGEWARHDGYLLAPAAPLADVDATTAELYAPAAPIIAQPNMI